MVFIFFGKDYFGRSYLEISWKGWGKLQLSWYSYADYLVFKQKTLSAAQDKMKPSEFIEFALRECGSCNFLIFDCGDKNKFVQFWLGDGKLILDWPIMKTNKLEKYTYAMLGVLNELGIHELSSFPKKPKIVSHYTVGQTGNNKIYQIDFKKNYDQAATLVKTLFIQIFRQKLIQLRYQIG